MLAVASVILCSLVLPAAALAKNKGVAPPGNSGVNQYVEDLPTLSGGKPTHSVAVAPVGSGGSGGSGGSQGSGGSGASAGTAPPASTSPVPRSVSKSLNHHGQAGKQAAALAAGTAAASQELNTGHRVKVEPASATGQLLGALTGSSGSGLGSLLPVILIVSLLVLSGVGLFKRRRTG